MWTSESLRFIHFGIALQVHQIENIMFWQILSIFTFLFNILFLLCDRLPDRLTIAVSYIGPKIFPWLLCLSSLCFSSPKNCCLPSTLLRCWNKLAIEAPFLLINDNGNIAIFDLLSKPKTQTMRIYCLVCRWDTALFFRNLDTSLRIMNRKWNLDVLEGLLFLGAWWWTWFFLILGFR